MKGLQHIYLKILQNFLKYITTNWGYTFCILGKVYNKIRDASNFLYSFTLFINTNLQFTKIYKDWHLLIQRELFLKLSSLILKDKHFHQSRFRKEILYKKRKWIISRTDYLYRLTDYLYRNKIILTSIPRDLLTCGAELGDVGCDPALAAAAIAAAINAFPEGVAYVWPCPSGSSEDRWSI